MIPWPDIRVLSFDCYGTLIDWERGLLEALLPWAERSGLISAEMLPVEREEAIERLLGAFGAAEACREREPFREYPDVLRLVMHDIGVALGGEVTQEDAERLAGSVGAWPEFADTVDGLRSLKKRFKLVIVSNVDHASFARTRLLLGVEFDAVVIAEDVRSYKPAPAHFDEAERVVRSMGLEPSAWVHVAQSLFHDIAPASARGLRTVWVDRRAGRGGGATREVASAPRADLVVPDLRSLVGACGA